MIENRRPIVAIAIDGGIDCLSRDISGGLYQPNGFGRKVFHAASLTHAVGALLAATRRAQRTITDSSPP